MPCCSMGHTGRSPIRSATVGRSCRRVPRRQARVARFRRPTRNRRRLLRTRDRCRVRPGRCRVRRGRGPIRFRRHRGRRCPGHHRPIRRQARARRGRRRIRCRRPRIRCSRAPIPTPDRHRSDRPARRPRHPGHDRHRPVAAIATTRRCRSRKGESGGLHSPFNKGSVPGVAEPGPGILDFLLRLHPADPHCAFDRFSRL